MHTLLSTLAMLALLLFSSPAMAIYKCESDGKTTYSDVPCGAGMREIDADAPPPDAEAQRRAQQEKAALQRMEATRSRQQAADEKERQRALKKRQARQKQCSELALRLKWAREDAEQTYGRSRDKALRNARRAEERYDLRCTPS